MCNCIINVEEKLIERVKETNQGEIEGGKILQSHFHFTENGFGPRTTYSEFQFTLSPLKKDGTIGKPKKQTVNISHTYCPFCGKKHKQ
jgi:hypothetical protein